MSIRASRAGGGRHGAIEPGRRTEIPLGGELPPPDTRLRRLTLRTVALAAVLVTVGYLGWRIGWTMPPARPGGSASPS